MKLLVLFLCVASTLAVPLEQSPLVTLKDLHFKSSPADQRIIGGNPAVLGQFPWQVAIQFQTSAGYFFCGGSLISDEWVLTAAHCAEGAFEFVMYVGTVTLDSDDRVVIVSTTAIVHPNYNSASLINDVALVKLDGPLTFTDNIKSIALPPRGVRVGVGVSAIAVGWGTVSDDEVYVSNELNYTPLTTISNSDCAAIYGSVTVIDSTLCAVGNPYNSTCSGDSGGPFFNYDANGEPVLIGVISFVSNQGCASGLPSGYGRTESHLSWISENTGLPL